MSWCTSTRSSHQATQYRTGNGGLTERIQAKYPLSYAPTNRSDSLPTTSSNSRKTDRAGIQKLPRLNNPTDDDDNDDEKIWVSVVSRVFGNWLNQVTEIQAVPARILRIFFSTKPKCVGLVRKVDLLSIYYIFNIQYILLQIVSRFQIFFQKSVWMMLNWLLFFGVKITPKFQHFAYLARVPGRNGSNILLMNSFSLSR